LLAVKKATATSADTESRTAIPRFIFVFVLGLFLLQIYAALQQHKRNQRCPADNQAGYAAQYNAEKKIVHSIPASSKGRGSVRVLRFIVVSSPRENGFVATSK
jgi:hypothetical protein